METPNAVGKNRPRRSLSLRASNKKNSHHHLRDDAVESPEMAFGASPNLTTSASDSRLNLECSTPVNSNRKRSFFVEDSSPYLDSNMDTSGLHQASPVPYTMSQEMRRIGVDVVWQWNSPKRNANNDYHADSDHIPLARKRRKSFTMTRSAAQDASGSSSSGTDKATGFYKIREELLKAKKEDNLFMRLLKEDISPCDPEEAAHKTTVCPVGAEKEPLRESTNDPDATLTRKLSDDYLNDSENDENLLIVSQETEKKAMEKELDERQQREEQNITLKTATSVLKAKEISFTKNDSFDQYLIDGPFDFDELLNRNARNLDQTLVNPTPTTTSSNSGTTSSGSTKGSLNRTLSLPPDTEQIIMGISSSGGRSISRHESMPSTATGGGGGCVSKFSASNPHLTMSSSTESLSSVTSSSTERIRMCTQDEIARKRQIAQERLKCKQLQKNRQRLTQEQQPPKR